LVVSFACGHKQVHGVGSSCCPPSMSYFAPVTAVGHEGHGKTADVGGFDAAPDRELFAESKN
jgi:hypothetical protein